MNPNQQNIDPPHPPGQSFHPDQGASSPSQPTAANPNPTPVPPQPTPNLQQPQYSTHPIPQSTQPINNAIPPKKSRKLLLIFLALILFAGGGTAYMLFSSDNSSDNPEEIASSEQGSEFTVEVPADWVNAEHEGINYVIRIPADWEKKATFDTNFNGTESVGANWGNTELNIGIGTTIIQNVTSLSGLSSQLNSDFELFNIPGASASEIYETINGRQWLVRTTTFEGTDPATVYYAYIDELVGFATLTTGNSTEFEDLVRQIAGSVSK